MNNRNVKSKRILSKFFSNLKKSTTEYFGFQYSITTAGTCYEVTLT